MKGWVSFHRQIMKWEWYTDPNTFRLFFHLVLNANHEKANWRGTEIKRGQLVTSSEQLALQLNLSRQQIRTSISKLKSTNEITTKSTNKYTLVTVEKYDLYQSDKDKSTSKTPSKQQTNNQQITTNNNVNKNNKNNIVDFFEECWKLYPSKKGKGQVSDSKKKEIYKLGEEFKRCIERYKSYVDNNDWLKYQNGSTFFNSGYVDYLDDNFTEEFKTSNNNFTDLSEVTIEYADGTKL